MTFHRLLLLTFLFLWALPACADENPAIISGTVNRVYDGDTLEVSGIGKVRLIGIDAPEREASERDWYLRKQGVSQDRIRKIYRAAKEYCIRHAKGKNVILSLDRPTRDRYGRLLAYVYLPDDTLLNLKLLREGLAVVYRKFSFQKKEDFLAAEEQAQKDKVGLWE